MGVTVTAFTNGTKMEAAAFRSNLQALRRFTNRGAVAGDITGLFKSRNFVKPESFGNPSPRTVASSSIVWGSGVDGTAVKRAYGMYDAMDTTWHWVPGGARTIYVPEARVAEITVNVWAWHIGSNTRVAEDGTYNNTLKFAAKVAIRVDGVVEESTERRVWDAGRNPPDNWADLTGYYKYSAVNRSLTTLVELAEGEHTIGLVSKMEWPAAVGDIGRLTIGARMCMIEFMRR